MVGTKKQDYSLLSGHKRNEITETLSNISPYVSESKTDTGLHTVIFVSGPWILDSGFQSLLVSEIPDTLSSISDSETQVSAFHKQTISRIADSGSFLYMVRKNADKASHHWANQTID